MALKTGVANTAGSLKLNTLDLAKIGQLYLNCGVYNGLRVLSADWTENSLTLQIEIPFLDDAFYGYFFWNQTFHVDGKSYECFYASGNGGNKIFILEDLHLDVVITAQAYNSTNMHVMADEMMREYILKAVIPQ